MSNIDDDLQPLCNQWQKILRLEGWRVEAKMVRFWDIESGNGGLSSIAYHRVRKEAEIRILEAIDLPPRERFDSELQIVRQLTWLHFVPFESSPCNSVEAQAETQASYMLAYALRQQKGLPKDDGSRKILLPLQLEQRCELWKQRLRLQDWNTEIRFVRRQEMLSPANQGECSYNRSRMEARIRILEEIDQQPGDATIKMDHDLTLVHELIHLWFAPFMVEEEDDEDNITQENAIDLISAALVNLARGIIPPLEASLELRNPILVLDTLDAA